MITSSSKNIITRTMGYRQLERLSCFAKKNDPLTEFKLYYSTKK